jgi:hypothetical protein
MLLALVDILLAAGRPAVDPAPNPGLGEPVGTVLRQHRLRSVRADAGAQHRHQPGHWPADRRCRGADPTAAWHRRTGRRLKITRLIGGGLAGVNVIGTVTIAATGAAVGMGTRAVAGLALRGRAAAPAAASTGSAVPARAQPSLG